MLFLTFNLGGLKRGRENGNLSLDANFEDNLNSRALVNLILEICDLFFSIHPDIRTRLVKIILAIRNKKSPIYKKGFASFLSDKFNLTLNFRGVENLFFVTRKKLMVMIPRSSTENEIKTSKKNRGFPRIDKNFCGLNLKCMKIYN